MKKINLRLKIVLALIVLKSSYNAQTAAALSFDGVNDFVNCGNILPGSYTKEAWINISTLAGNNNIISSGGTSQHAFWVNTFNRLSAGHNGSFTACQDPTAVLNNTWYHMACTYDAATTTMRLYKNGVIVATNTNVPAYTGGNSARIGSYSPASHFSGRMDEVRVWNRALCQGEIQNNMNAEIATVAPGLIANYHFNQGVASGTNTGVTALTDFSGSSNTGTLTNFALSGTSSNWISPGGVSSGSTVVTFVNPTITITGATSICNGLSTVLTATGNATTFTWTSGPNTQTYNVSPTVTTTYSVVGRNNLGCITNIASRTLTVNARPTVLVNSGDICSGNSFTVVPSGANTYTISGGSFIVAPITTTSYSVTGTDLNGCISSSAAVSAVSVNITPTISVNSGAICTGSSFTIAPSGADTYTISGGSAIVAPTSNDTYSVTGTSAGGCIGSNTAISSVTVNLLPTVSVNSGAICSGDSFTIVPSGADTYTISGGSSIVAPTSDVTYSVTGTDLNGCLSSNTAVSSVTVNFLPTVSVNSGAICSGDSFTIVPSGADTYTITGGSSIVAPTSDASYSITGTNLNGCINSSPAVSSVTVNILPTISVNSGAICTGDSFTIVPSGADTYTISGGVSVVAPTSDASYSITGTSLEGCLSSNTAVSSVTVNVLPIISVNSGAICSGDSFTIAPSGADTYTISGGSSIVAPTADASYSITGTDLNGCLSANTAISSVTVNLLPVVSVNSGAICIGSSFTIVPNGANTYTISGGSSIVAPTSDATYSVTGTDLNGCLSSNIAVSSVTVNLLPTVSVNSGAICSGDSFTIIPSGADVYTITGGSSVVTPISDNTYSVTGTDLNGCLSSNIAVSSVTVNILPTISVNSGAICSGDSFTIVPSGADTYTISGGGLSIVTPTISTSYSVIGTDLNGCVNSNSAISSITVNMLPVITVPSATICAGATGTLIASGANTYTWSTGSNSASITDNPIVDATYTVNGTSINGCLAASAVIATITIGPAPSIVLNSATVCAGSSATLSASGVTSYTWNTGANTNSIVVTPTANTTYVVSGDLIGCSLGATNSATVTLNTLPNVSANSGEICIGTSFTIIPSGANTFTISGGSNVVTPTANAAYSVTGTDINGCVSSNTAISSVTVNALPIITVPSVTICIGTTGTLTANGASTYSWNTGSNATSISDNPTVNTTYSVNGTSIAGCVGASPVTATITVGSVPSLFVNSATVCAGTSATLNASGVTSYTWNTGANTNSIVVTPTANTTYSVSGNLTGCVASASNTSTVSVNSLPVVNVSSVTICVGETGTLSASGASSYTWNTGETSSTIIISPTVTTNYTVNGMGANGCVNVIAVSQSVSTCTGIQSLSNSSSLISVYPNPSAGVFNIDLPYVSTITVVDALGKTVYNQHLQDGKHIINLTNYTNGFYILKAESNGHYKTVRLVKN
jgi:hypothetical protein